jgi:hypothetical protein
MGALGSAAEHWMEVTIGGDKQEPRQRLVAVPFALRAGSVTKKTEYYQHIYTFKSGLDGYAFLIDGSASELLEVSFRSNSPNTGGWKIEKRPILEYSGWSQVAGYTNQEAEEFKVGDWSSKTYFFKLERPLDLDSDFVYRFTGKSDNWNQRQISLKLKR